MVRKIIIALCVIIATVLLVVTLDDIWFRLNRDKVYKTTPRILIEDELVVKTQDKVYLIRNDKVDVIGEKINYLSIISFTFLTSVFIFGVGFIGLSAWKTKD